LRTHPHDRAALRALPGRKLVLTNAPLAYAERVLEALGLAHLFDGVIGIERMRMFGHWRPKPDRRMLRRVAARLRVAPSHCVLVEDTLAHQKAARSLGMRTVWMQRWLMEPPRSLRSLPPKGARTGSGRPGTGSDRQYASKVGVYLLRRPAYVCVRIRSLQQLQRVP
jgi:putative hydrolase of the HAD superfamily